MTKKINVSSIEIKYNETENNVKVKKYKLERECTVYCNEIQ